MSSTFQVRLDEAMQMRGMNATDLANATAISKSRISHYLSGRHVPNSKGLVALARALNVNEQFLLGINDEPAASTPPPSTIEQWESVYNAPARSVEDDFFDQLSRRYGKRASKLLSGYDELNEKGQIRAVGLVDDLTEIPKYQKNPTLQTVRIPVYDDPAAAGSPLYAESSFEYEEYPADQIPSSADFGIRILGDSMCPTIENGSIVWVEKTSELYTGDVGIFMLDGGDAVCKRVKLNNIDQVIALLSDNPNYPSIIGSDLEGLQVVGKVIL